MWKSAQGFFESSSLTTWVDHLKDIPDIPDIPQHKVTFEGEASLYHERSFSQLCRGNFFAFSNKLNLLFAIQKQELHVRNMINKDGFYSGGYNKVYHDLEDAFAVEDYPNQRFFITDIRLSPCEKYLLLSTKLKGVVFEVRDILNEELFITFTFSLRKNTTLFSLEWTPGAGKSFITLDDAYQLHLFSLASRKEKWLYDHHFLVVCFSACGKFIFGITVQRKDLIIIDAESFKVLKVRPMIPLNWACILLPMKIFEPFPGVLTIGCLMKHYFAPPEDSETCIVIVTDYFDDEATLNFHYIPLTKNETQIRPATDSILFYFGYHSPYELFFAGNSYTNSVHVFSLKRDGKIARISSVKLQGFCRGLTVGYVNLPPKTVNESTNEDKNISPTYCPLIRLLIMDSHGKVSTFIYTHSWIKDQMIFDPMTKELFNHEQVENDYMPYKNFNREQHKITLSAQVAEWSCCHEDDFLFLLPHINGRILIEAVPSKLKIYKYETGRIKKDTKKRSPSLDSLDIFRKSSSSLPLLTTRKISFICQPKPASSKRSQSLPLKLKPTDGGFRGESREGILLRNTTGIPKRTDNPSRREKENSPPNLPNFLSSAKNTEFYLPKKNLLTERSSLMRKPQRNPFRANLFSQVLHKPEPSARTIFLQTLNQTSLIDSEEEKKDKKKLLVIKYGEEDYVEENERIILHFENEGVEIHCSNKHLSKWVLFPKIKHFKERKDNIIQMGCEDSSKNFLIFLSYINGQKLRLNTANVCELYQTADKFCWDGLQRECRNYMTGNMNVLNLCSFLELALKMEDKILHFYCVMYMIQNNDQIKRLEGMNYHLYLQMFKLKMFGFTSY